MGLLRVGASDMTLRYYLLDYIEQFCALYPKVKLSITNAPTPVTVAELARGNLDFCVVSEPVEIPLEMTCVPVREIRDICVAGAKYIPHGRALSDKFEIFNSTDSGTLNRKELVSLSDLAGERIITLDRGTSTRRHIDNWLSSCSAPESLSDPDIELATSDLIVDFVSRGIGVAFVMEDFARSAICRGEVREIKLETPPPVRKFLLVKLKKAPVMASARKFISLLNVEV